MRQERDAQGDGGRGYGGGRERDRMTERGDGDEVSCAKDGDGCQGCEVCAWEKYGNRERRFQGEGDGRESEDLGL